MRDCGGVVCLARSSIGCSFTSATATRAAGAGSGRRVCVCGDAAVVSAVEATVGAEIPVIAPEPPSSVCALGNVAVAGAEEAVACADEAVVDAGVVVMAPLPLRFHVYAA